eukprot:m.123994 g.123994  ORF g.123994 m.123994 type:complete len:542 (-) comp9419_c1_seq1:1523-3148(-)
MGDPCPNLLCEVGYSCTYIVREELSNYCRCLMLSSSGSGTRCHEITDCSDGGNEWCTTLQKNCTTQTSGFVCEDVQSTSSVGFVWVVIAIFLALLMVTITLSMYSVYFKHKRERERTRLNETIPIHDVSRTNDHVGLLDSPRSSRTRHMQQQLQHHHHHIDFEDETMMLVANQEAALLEQRQARQGMVDNGARTFNSNSYGNGNSNGRNNGITDDDEELEIMWSDEERGESDEDSLISNVEQLKMFNLSHRPHNPIVQLVDTESESNFGFQSAQSFLYSLDEGDDTATQSEYDGFSSRYDSSKDDDGSSFYDADSYTTAAHNNRSDSPSAEERRLRRRVKRSRQTVHENGTEIQRSSYLTTTDKKSRDDSGDIKKNSSNIRRARIVDQDSLGTDGIDIMELEDVKELQKAAAIQKLREVMTQVAHHGHQRSLHHSASNSYKGTVTFSTHKPAKSKPMPSPARSTTYGSGGMFKQTTDATNPFGTIIRQTMIDVKDGDDDDNDTITAVDRGSNREATESMRRTTAFTQDAIDHDVTIPISYL